MRGTAAIAMALGALAMAPAASAQLPGVPIPPIGPPGGPPPGGPPPQQPPPQNQPPAAQPLGSPPTGSVTVGVDPSHDGFVDDPNLVPPLQRRWKRDFSKLVGPVRAAEGRIFVLASDDSSSELHALDPLTGRDIWAHAIPVSVHLAYDGGRLFTIGVDGIMRAFSAADGSQLWQHETTQGSESPVAAGGAVYVMAKGNLLALNGANGSELWKTMTSGSEDVPAVDDDRVYVAYACADVRAFNRANGKQLWQRPTDCHGGGGSLPALFGPQLFVPERGLVLDRAGGAEQGTFFGNHTPTFGHGIGLFREDDTVIAKDQSSGKQLWSNTTHENLPHYETRHAPLAVYHSAYRLDSQGGLFALSLETGQKVWSTRAANFVPAADGQTLEAAPGLLLAPIQRRLSAYESAYRPKPGGIAFQVRNGGVRYPGHTWAAGVIGSSLRGPHAHVRIEYDEQPYKRFRRGKRGNTSADGFFSYTLRPDRNVRVRFRSRKAVSGVRTIYVYPRVHFGFGRVGPNRVRTTISVRAARSIHLSGRAAVLYVGRARQNRYDRLDSTRLERAGRGRTKATFIFDALRHTGKRDVVAVCIKGQARLGLGRPDKFLKRCGARRIQY